MGCCHCEPVRSDKNSSGSRATASFFGSAATTPLGSWRGRFPWAAGGRGLGGRKGVFPVRRGHRPCGRGHSARRRGLSRLGCGVDGVGGGFPVRGRGLSGGWEWGVRVLGQGIPTGRGLSPPWEKGFPNCGLGWTDDGPGFSAVRNGLSRKRRRAVPTGERPCRRVGVAWPWDGRHLPSVGKGRSEWRKGGVLCGESRLRVSLKRIFEPLKIWSV